MTFTQLRHKPNLFRDTKTGIIYFRKFRKGFNHNKQMTKSTGTSDVGKAVMIAKELDAIHFGEKKEKNIRKLVEDEWPNFLENQRSKAPATHASMEIQGRRHILPYFGDKFIHEVNEDLWEKYISFAIVNTPGRKLFNDRKYLAMFLRHMYRTQKISRMPILRDPDPERRAGKVFSTYETERLYAEANPNLQLQIAMALTMGMRLSEILFMSWDRIDMEKRIIHLRAEDTKIRRARSFAISDEVYNKLVLRSLSRPKSDYLFPNPQDPSKSIGRQGNKTAWRACRRRAGVRGRFHDLRHTFLTRAFKEAINPALICHYAGLSLEEANRTYLHFSPEDTRVVATLVGVAR